jgi:hypothetical protein
MPAVTKPIVSSTFPIGWNVSYPMRTEVIFLISTVWLHCESATGEFVCLLANLQVVPPSAT